MCSFCPHFNSCWRLLGKSFTDDILLSAKLMLLCRFFSWVLIIVLVTGSYCLFLICLNFGTISIRNLLISINAKIAWMLMIKSLWGYKFNSIKWQNNIQTIKDHRDSGFSWSCCPLLIFHASGFSLSLFTVSIPNQYSYQSNYPFFWGLYGYGYCFHTCVLISTWVNICRKQTLRYKKDL